MIFSTDSKLGRIPEIILYDQSISMAFHGNAEIFKSASLMHRAP